MRIRQRKESVGPLRGVGAPTQPYKAATCKQWAVCGLAGRWLWVLCKGWLCMRDMWLDCSFRS